MNIKDKINKKDVGLAKDYFELLKNSCGYETHCFDDYTNTLDKKYLKQWEEARKDRSDVMDSLFKIFNVDPLDESWCKIKHISLTAMGCQENAVRLIGSNKEKEINNLIKIHNNCYFIFLSILGINEKNMFIGSSA